MSNFECRMVDHDGDDEWNPVVADNEEAAAIQYAYDCSARSTPEILADEDDTETIIVRDADGKETKWVMSAFYDYRIRADEIFE